MFGAAASPGGWNWNMVSSDQDVLVATVGLPVGLDDTLLSGGPLGLGRGLLAGRLVLDGVVPPFGVLATDGTRFAAQQDWFGMASIYIYRAHGVVAFSNRPILLPYVLGDRIHPHIEGFARYAACDAFVGSISPVMDVKPLGPGEAFVGKRRLNNTWKIQCEPGQLPGRRRSGRGPGSTLTPIWKRSRWPASPGPRRASPACGPPPISCAAGFPVAATRGCLPPICSLTASRRGSARTPNIRRKVWFRAG
jgi:hypothetical protein